jgi:hypothetical protein
MSTTRRRKADVAREAHRSPPPLLDPVPPPAAPGESTKELREFLKQYEISRKATTEDGDEETACTHSNMYLAKAYSIPDAELGRFRRLYALSISEDGPSATNTLVESYGKRDQKRVYCELDGKQHDVEITEERERLVITTLQRVVREVLHVEDERQLEVIVARNISNPKRRRHYHMPGVVLEMKEWMHHILRRLKRELPAELSRMLDTGTSGLRMVGSGKALRRDRNGTRTLDLMSRYLPSGLARCSDITAELIQRYSIIPTPGQRPTPLNEAYRRMDTGQAEESKDGDDARRAEILAAWATQGEQVGDEALRDWIALVSPATSKGYQQWASVVTTLDCLRDAARGEDGDEGQRLRDLVHEFSARGGESYREDSVDHWLDRTLKGALKSKLEKVATRQRWWTPVWSLVSRLQLDTSEGTARKWCADWEIVWPMTSKAGKRTLSSVLEDRRSRPRRGLDREFAFGEHANVSLELIGKEQPGVVRPLSWRGKRILALVAQMGMGKTKAGLEYVKTLPADAKVLILSHRRSLTAELKRKWGFESYRDDHGGITGRRVICSVQSLWRLQSVEWDLLIIDEYTKVMAEVVNDKTVQFKAQTVIGRVEALIRHCARQVLIIDADMRREDVEWLSAQLRQDAESGTTSGIHVVAYEHTPHEEDVYELWDQKRGWRTALARALRQHKRVVIACASKDECKRLYEWIRREDDLKHLKVKVFHGGTDEKEKESAFDDFERACEGLDVLIYSPTISHGSSYEVEGHFDVVFGYFPSCGGVDADTCIQMLYRVRSITDRRYVLYMDVMEGDHPESRSELERQIRRRSELRRWEFLDNAHLVRMDAKTSSKEEVQYAAGFYYELFLHVTLFRNRSRNDLSGRILEGVLRLGVATVTVMRDNGSEEGEVPERQLVGRIEERAKEARLESATSIAHAEPSKVQRGVDGLKRVPDEETLARAREAPPTLRQDQATHATLRKVYEMPEAQNLDARWVLEWNQSQSMQAYERFKGRRDWTGEWREYHERRRLEAERAHLERVGNLLAFRDETRAEYLVECLAVILGLKRGAVAIGQRLSRAEFEEGVTRLNRDYATLEEQIETFLAETNGTRRNKKASERKDKGTWTARSAQAWLNGLLRRTYLTSLTGEKGTGNLVRSYTLTTLYTGHTVAATTPCV